MSPIFQMSSFFTNYYKWIEVKAMTLDLKD